MYATALHKVPSALRDLDDNWQVCALDECGLWPSPHAIVSIALNSDRNVARISGWFLPSVAMRSFQRVATVLGSEPKQYYI